MKSIEENRRPPIEEYIREHMTDYKIDCKAECADADDTARASNEPNKILRIIFSYVKISNICCMIVGSIFNFEAIS